jgi:hypothetical protein
MTTKKKRKKGLTIKIPKSEVETETTYEKVKAHLKKNPEYAYTRAGLMVEVYKQRPEDLNRPFGKWPEGAPSQYTRIRLSLDKLRKEGVIETKKQGKKFLYWWKGESK